MERDTDHTNRRNVLRTIGASAIGLSTVGTATARPNPFRRDLKRARKLREKTGDNDMFVKYLRKKGYPVWSKSTQSPLRTNQWGESEDDASTMRLYDGNLTGTLNLTAWHQNCDPDPYDIYFEYHFDVSTGSDTWGVEDDDGFSMGWPDNTFEIENDTWTSSSNVDFYDRSNNLNGLSFKYHDAEHINKNDSDSGYGGVHVRTEDGYSDSTTIAGKYVHTYKTLELCGFSVGTDGSMSWDFCADGKKDYMGHVQKDWSEAEHNWTNC